MARGFWVFASWSLALRVIGNETKRSEARIIIIKNSKTAVDPDEVVMSREVNPIDLFEVAAYGKPAQDGLILFQEGQGFDLLIRALRLMHFQLNLLDLLRWKGATKHEKLSIMRVACIVDVAPSLGENWRQGAIVKLDLNAAEVPFVGNDLDALDSSLSGETNHLQLASCGPLEAKARRSARVSK